MSGLVPGRMIAEKYRLVAPLGRGAMGEVWRAEHVLLQTPLALKFIDPNHVAGTHVDAHAALERFFREARATAALRSPHVVQLFDFGQDGGVPYIAMELLEGETLEQRLERVRVLSPRQTADFITHIARAIGKAHEAGIIHRDLKPGNVFLIRNDDEEVAKVLDFGIAKVASGPGSYRSTQTGTVVGTPMYMSPEQVQASRTLDHRADLWSLAVIAFECLIGRTPFDGESYGALVLAICAVPIPVPSAWAAVPPGFDAWFAKAASRDPKERFQSARELSESLRFVLCPEMRMAQPSFPSELPPVSPAAVSFRNSAHPASLVSSGAVPAGAFATPAPGVVAPVWAAASTAQIATAATSVGAPHANRSPVPTHQGLVSVIEAPARGRSRAVVLSLAAGALSLMAVVVGYLQLGASGRGSEPSVAASADPAASKADTSGGDRSGDQAPGVASAAGSSAGAAGAPLEPQVQPAGVTSSRTPPDAPPEAAASAAATPSKPASTSVGGSSSKPASTSVGHSSSRPPSNASRRLGY